MLKLDLSGATPELYLYGLIAAPSWWSSDDTVSAAGVLQALDQIDPGAELIVRLNSGGGDVFEGITIYNALARRGPRLEVQVDALAASIASVIAMAGEEITIAGNAMLMIHRAWTIAQGDSAELAKISTTLAQLDDVILDTYEARVGEKSTRQQIADWVAAETWMTPAEAVARGFATRVGALQSGVAASIHADRFKNTPQHLLRKSSGTPRPASRSVAIAARLRAVRSRLGVEARG